MKKVDRVIPFLLIVLLLQCLAGQLLYASVDPLLISIQIEGASQEELREMLSLNNLTVGDGEDPRSVLYAYYGIEKQQETSLGPKENSYQLKVEQASQMKTDPITRVITLEGDVEVSFLTEGSKSAKRLMAQRMLIDNAHSILSASGSVLYQDPDGDAALQAIEGSIVTFDWNNQILIISSATTKSEKQNSEDEQVEIYTSGSKITYQGEDGQIFYNDGQIATRAEDPLSSIQAEQLSFLPGGDVMVHNATLRLGRVPVLWTPYFFFPGNRMVGNPAMGFTSDRGMFASTTWELYGTYPNFVSADQSSLTMLLGSTQQEDLYPQSILYSAQQPTSSLQKWAANTDSYLTMFADAYETAGVHVGYDSMSNYLDGKISLGSVSAIAAYPDGVTSLTSYSSAPVTRFYSVNSLKIDTDWADLEAVLPYYSDPKVLRLYGNRMTTFSFDSLLGMEQDFPTTYQSDITSFTWKLNGSFNFPVTKLNPYLSTLKISSIQADAQFKWQSDGSTYSYLLQTLNLPTLTASMEGTLFEFSSTINKATSSDDTDKNTASDTDLLLPNAYSIKSTSSSSSSSSAPKRLLSLSYSVTEKLTHTLDAELGVIQWDEDSYLYSLTKGSLLFKASPNTDLFVLSTELLPQYSYLEDQSKTIFRTSTYQVFNTNTITIPIIGLTYTLSQSLYRYQKNYTNTSGVITMTPTEQTYAFDDDSVTVHKLQLQKAFQAGSATLTPSITASLYPVTQSLLPTFTYAQGPLTVSSSFKFLEDDGSLEKDSFKNTVVLKSPDFNFSVKQAYDFTRSVDNWQQALSMTGSFDENLFSSLISLSQSFSYYVYSEDYIDNYFDYITLEAAIPYAKFKYTVDGGIDSLESNLLQVNLSGEDLEVRWWKGRVSLSLGFDTSLKFYFQDRYASTFSISASIRLQIAEFLDFTFQVTSSNNGFSHYYTSDDTFSFPLLWADLMRSFDFVGTGRYNTQFNLSEISIILVHDLDDWSLNCKYSGSVVLSNNQYSWVPTISIYLTWNTIPELDVNKTYTETDSVWSTTS